MTERRSTLRDSIKQLKNAAVPLEHAHRAQQRRDRVVGRLEELHHRLIDERARRGRWRRAAFGLLAAAIVPLAVWEGASGRIAGLMGAHAEEASASASARVSLIDGSVTTVRGGRSDTVRVGTPVDLGRLDRLQTARGAHAMVTLESGASVRVAEATELALLKLDHERGAEQLGLELGSIEVTVPKLSRGGRFEVKTPDATVVVHGTRFFVDSGRDAVGSVTDVRVTEGRVAVLHDGRESVLGPGAHWTSRHPGGGSQGPRAVASAGADLATPPPVDARSRAAPTVPLTPPWSRPSHSASPPLHDSVAAEPSVRREATVGEGGGGSYEVSSLAAENALFRAAMEASRSGDHDLALTRLGELTTRYPRSPLVQNVRVERFRLLRRVGRHPEAEREARRYLADYPGGFAEDEAKAIVLRRPEAP